MEHHHVIAIGGSAGSIERLGQLLAQLPSDLDAAVMVVIHLERHAPSNLDQIFRRNCALPVRFAAHQESIAPGYVYLAPPDYHLFVKPGKLHLVRGPLENRVRPAIDVLFRSAAVAYRDSVTGVILSGLLDDGTVGLQAIKRCGGYAIVQSPDEALFSSMPESAIAAVAVDGVVPISAMAERLLERVKQEPKGDSPVPEDLQLESQMVERAIFSSEKMTQLGQPMSQSCPACGGPLWQMRDDDSLRYRCHVGHSFTARSLVDAQGDAAEEALWVALRTLEERGRLLSRISDENRRKWSPALAESYQTKADEALKHASSIRKLLYSLGVSDTPANATDEN